MSRISQKGATGPLALTTPSGFQQTSSDLSLNTMVGSRWDLSDGREVILVSVGTTASLGSAGVLCQDTPIVANHAGLTTTVVTAYSSTSAAIIGVNLGATAVTANQYQGGFLSVDSGTGFGQYLKVASHPAAVASGSLAVTLEDTPNVNLVAASSVVSLVPPHGQFVVINPTTPTNVPVGITLYPLTASASVAVPNYGFLVTKGITGAISDSTAPGVGAAIAASTVTAGDIGKTSGTGTATIAFTSNVIGYTAVAAASGTSHSVFVNL